MAPSSSTNPGDMTAIETRIKRSLRRALAATLVIALVVPVAESIFVNSNTGTLVMRSIDCIALMAAILNFSNAYLLNRRLQKGA